MEPKKWKVTIELTDTPPENVSQYFTASEIEGMIKMDLEDGVTCEDTRVEEIQ